MVEENQQETPERSGFTKIGVGLAAAVAGAAAMFGLTREPEVQAPADKTDSAETASDKAADHARITEEVKALVGDEDPRITEARVKALEAMQQDQKKNGNAPYSHALTETLPPLEPTGRDFGVVVGTEPDGSITIAQGNSRGTAQTRTENTEDVSVVRGAKPDSSLTPQVGDVIELSAGGAAREAGAARK